MKSIKGLREQYELITEKEDKEQRKLTTLVRAGLFDAKKLPMLKRALDKGADKMTPAEKKILIDLLDSLMNQVISSDPVYMKVKRNVQGMNEELVVEAPVSISDVPSIVVLKRKAVRVYPGGQQVGLYYSQQLDKYVTIPFGEAGIAEETNLEEARKRKGSSKRFSLFGYSDDVTKKDDDDDNPRYLPNVMRKRYTDLTPDERKEVTPGKVFTGHVSRGGSVVDAAIMSLMARHFQKKYGKTFSPTAKVGMIGKSLQKITSQRRKSVKAVRKSAASAKPQTQQSTQKPTKAAPIKTKSKASTRAAMANTLKKNPNAKFSPAANRAAGIKENYQLKLQQIREARQYGAADAALDAASFVPGPAGTAASLASAGMSLSRGDYSGAALDVLGAVPILGYGAKAAKVAKVAKAAKAAKGAKTVGKGSKLLRRAKALGRLSRMKKGGKLGKWLKRGAALGALAGGFGGDGDGGAPTQARQSDQSWKTPVTHNRTSGLEVTKVGPQYSQGDAAQRRRDEILNRQANRAQLQREMVEIDIDGNTFEINSSIADKFTDVYNSLNESNKNKMLDMMLNEETYNKVIEFVTRY